MSPDIRILFFGDSFTVGVGDPQALGWVGRVCADALAQGHNLTAYNLGVRRETSGDILRRWENEAAPRTLPGVGTRVVFAFGANDTAVLDGQRRLTLGESLANTQQLLRAAKPKYPLLLIGPPPVDDAAHNLRIQELSRSLAACAQEAAVPYLDLYEPLKNFAPWQQEVRTHDGSHPRAEGYREWARLVLQWPDWWFYCRASH